MSTKHSVTSALNKVRDRISLAVSKSQNISRGSPRLVAVSKKHDVEQLMEAYKDGQRVFGENYVQELADKACKMPPDVLWHFIGRLQSNKVKALISGVQNLSVVETLDSLKLARKLNSTCEELNRRTPLEVFIQINTSKEDSKGGLNWDSDTMILELAEYVLKQCPYLLFKGLMTIGATGDLTCFDRLNDCQSALEKALPCSNERLEMSFGMSTDFEDAILKGSTNVRVGSAIFGARYYG